MSALRVTYVLLICLGQAAVGQQQCQYHFMGTETTPMGKIIKYKPINDSTYIVEYGIGDTFTQLEGSFSCYVPSYARPNFVSENDHFLFLTSGCGSGCRIGHIIPMDTSRQLRIVPNWVVQSLDRNWILSIDGDFNNQQIFFTLLNIETGVETVEQPSTHCDYANPMDCLSKVDIGSNEIIVNWSKELEAPPYIISLKD